MYLIDGLMNGGDVDWATTYKTFPFEFERLGEEKGEGALLLSSFTYDPLSQLFSQVSNVIIPQRPIED